MPLEVGSLLYNRYHIEEIIAQGGMGAIYRASDQSLGIQVAIKENLFPSEESTRQFRREATLLAGLRHPNLPRVTDHFAMADLGQYLVMDFIEGDDLRQRMAHSGRMSEDEVIAVGAAVCDALAYLHSRVPPVVHRDIKPGNIKITPSGQVFLVDFGLAKIAQAGQATTTGAQALTPGYASPEQYGQGTSPLSDLYSLGATLYAVLTGRIPEDALARAMGSASLGPLRRFNSAVSERTAAVIEKAMSVRPEERYPTAHDLRAALLSAAPSRLEASPTAFMGSAAAGQAGTVRAGLPPTPAQPPASAPAAPVFPTSAAPQVPPSPVPAAVAGPAAPPKPRRPIAAFVVIGLLVVAIAAVLILGLLKGAPAANAPQATASATDAATAAATTAAPTAPDPTSTLAPTPQGGAGATPQGGAGATPQGGAGATPQGGASATQAPTSTQPDPSQTPAPSATPAPSLTPTLIFSPTPAATPIGGGEGQVGFVSNRTGLPQVWLKNADGTTALQLTNVSDGACQPDWSPDGQRLVFVSPCRSRLESYPGSSLYIYDMAGGALSPLPSVPGGDYEPAWSPDGSQIAFTSIREGAPHIYVIKLADNSVTRLTGAYSHDFRPAWSPDGKSLAFLSTRLGGQQVWTMDASGANAREFTLLSLGPAYAPAWSADGKYIIFLRNISLPSLYIKPVGALTASEVPLAETVRPVQGACYSYDGQWIAYESWTSGNHDLYLMRANGSGATQLTTDPNQDYEPVWRP